MGGDPQSALKIQTRLKELHKCVKEVEEARAASEPTLAAITEAHKRAEVELRVNRTDLRAKYDCGVKEALHEEELLRKALSKIYEIRDVRREMRIASKNAGNKETIRRGALMKMLASSAETIPLWVGRDSESPPPPLAGAIPPEPNYVASCGDMAAALVRSPDGDENWILAEVVSFNPATGKYEVSARNIVAIVSAVVIEEILRLFAKILINLVPFRLTTSTKSKRTGTCSAKEK